MNKFLFIALIACVFVSSVVAEDDEVPKLTDDSFDDFIQANEFVLVKFYAEWCGHCKKLAPEFAKAQIALKSAATPCQLVKVDAPENKKLSEKFGIQGFPTLKFFAKGEPIDYNGGRTEKDIIAWVTKRTGSVLTPLKTTEEFDQFLKDNKVAVVIFSQVEEGELYAAFKTVAMGFDKLGFAIVSSDEVRGHAKAEFNKVVLFKQFDEGRVDYNNEHTVGELKSFVDTNSFATVMEFDDRAIEKVFQQGNPTIFLFCDNSDPCVTAGKEFEISAKAHKGGKVLFSISKPDDGHGHFQRLADYVGANTKKLPSVMLVHSQSEVHKYKFDKEVTKENLESFVNDFNNNRLENYKKSEEIPEKNDEPVKVIVGKNYESEVINNEKDILIKFYAPWCGHCKQLAPKWDAAAEKLKSNPNIVIAKCDATANEISGINIKGFPTIKFFPAHSKNAPIDFDGDRTEEGIIKFLKEHTSHPWVEVPETAEKKDDL